MFWHEEIVKLVKYLLSKLHGDGRWVCSAICDTVVVIQCDCCNTVELDRVKSKKCDAVPVLGNVLM